MKNSGSTQESGPVQDMIPAIKARPHHRGHKTRGPHKRLLALVLTLVILVTTGAGGMLLLQARAYRDEQAQKVTPTQTAHSYPTYLPGNGTLAFFDPLSQERGSQWSSYSVDSTDGVCQFTGGAYHVSQPANGYFTLCAATGTFRNFAFEVQLTITRGDCGGITFRMEEAFEHFYYFAICQNGESWLTKFVSAQSSDAQDFYHSTNSAIHTGLGHQNKIAVVADDSIMTIYVNEQQIVHEQDSSYSLGQIALTANPYYLQSAHATDVAYNNARLWTL